MKAIKLISFILAYLLVLPVFGYYNIDEKKNKSARLKSIAANCTPATAARELNINNVRARLMTGGDMWWDLLGMAQYEVPKGGRSTAIFAGALWLGGQDVSGQLKVAAQRFRSNGNDYWPGPLNTVDASIEGATCAEYDKFWETYRQEIADFVAFNDALRADAENGTTTAQQLFPDYSRPPVIDEWPAHGRNFPPYNEDFYLAPFTDVDGDGLYNPDAGDYPRYDLQGQTECNQRIVDIYGDQNLWWVFNDKGNVHTETGAQPIGMEIRAQGFSFATNDELNLMTFYNYELVNRSTFTLTETYFGVWVDADVGCSQDDFVGCDVPRGVGYAYNGTNFDADCGGVTGYGAQPPAIGVDFFQGPFQDNDGLDNPLTTDCREAVRLGGIPYGGIGIGYGDGIIDNERFGMRKFLYHDNNSSPRGDPRTGVEYYNYLRAFWRDNTRMIYGGTGNINDPTADPNTPANYMFPALTDSVGFGTNCVAQPNWTEITAGNTPFDRRFMQSAGPFTLAPGAVNNITFGVVFARAPTGGNFASVEAMLRADDKAQALFDACFQLLNGPDAPELVIRELDQELIIKLTNRPVSNNFGEGYVERDPFIIPPDTFPASHPRAGETLTADDKIEWSSYKFQGYLVYQVKDNTVSAADLDDRSKARLVFQCDVKDDVAEIINWEFDEDLNQSVPVRKVRGVNQGISTSFVVTEDVFASINPRLVNHKTYYYIAIAYAHNEFAPFDPAIPGQTQAAPFLGSRKSPSGAIRTYSAIPHKNEVLFGGLIMNSKYGDGVPITRIEGAGNSGNNLRITDESKAVLFEEGTEETFKIKHPTYEAGFGPVNIKVVDPVSVVEGDFVLAFVDSTLDDLTDAQFVVYGTQSVNGVDEPIDTIFSNRTIEIGSEILLLDYGISVSIEQANNPDDIDAVQNGFIAAEINYENTGNRWLSGVADRDGQTFYNWILSGTVTDPNETDFNDRRDRNGRAIDSLEAYESILGGIVAPYRLTASHAHGPMAGDIPVATTLFQGLGGPVNFRSHLSFLESVNIVFTSDKSKWTRVPVVEMHASPGQSQGGVSKGRLRAAPSLDKNGNAAAPNSGASTDINAANFISDSGMSWFPGYAYSLETGERLNMAFGESSFLIGENGRDMIWNPTSTEVEGPFQDIRFGGKHYLFVFRNNVVEDELFQLPLMMNSGENLMPAYDHGKFMVEKLKQNTNPTYVQVWRACNWAMLPLLAPNSELLSMEDGLIPNDVTISLRVSKSFRTLATEPSLDVTDNLEIGKNYFVRRGPISHDGVTYRKGEVFRATATTFSSTQNSTNSSVEVRDVVVPVTNNALPLYNFTTKGMGAIKNNTEVAENSLDIINVVPNPYYAFSGYEVDRLDNRIKITNLPQTCSIKIYALNGTLVRQFEKDDPTISSLDWDLRNNSNVMVASGIYYIHVNVPGVGEKVLKWFGVMRPIDLDAF